MAEPTSGLYVELRALTAKFSQDMDGAVKTVLGVEKKISGAFNTIGKVAQAALLVGAVASVMKLGEKLGQLADKGDQLDDLTESFRNFGGQVSELDKAKEAMLGTVSSIDLMKIANQGLLRQIPDFQEKFASMADYAARFAEATGGDAKGALEQLVDALGKAKESQLASLGIVIDSDKAYSDYAKSIGVSTQYLSDAQKLQARQIAAENEMLNVKTKLLPMQDSLNAAQKAFNVTLDEASAQFGAGIAANESFTKAYRELSEVMAEIDWRALGAQAAEFFATIFSAASKTLPVIIGWAEKIGTTFGYVFGDSLADKFNRASVELADLKSELSSVDQRAKSNPFGGPLGKKLFGWTDEDIQNEKSRLSQAIADQEKVLQDLSSKMNSHGEVAKEVNEKKVDGSKKVTSQLSLEVQKVEALKDRWDEMLNQNSDNDLRKKIQKSIETLNSADFNNLTEKLRTSVEQGFVDKWKDAIASGAVSLDDVMEEARKEGQRTVDEFTQRFADKLKTDLASAFDTVADKIGAIGDKLGVDLKGIADAFKQLPEETKAKWADSLGSMLGLDKGDTQGLGQIFSTLESIIGSIVDAKKLDKESKSNKGTGAAVGAGLGAIAGYYFGGPMGAQIGAEIGKSAGKAIGGLFKWGPQNPETLARHAFANFIEDQFSKLAQVSFFDAKGKLQSIAGNKFNFLEGSTGRFNAPDWGKDMDAWGEKAKGTFIGLGQALEEVLGLTEDVGAQIGFLLGENLGGNIDNARLLVYQLGLSFDDLQGKLLDAAKNGEMRWSEFTANIAGLKEAFKPGLAGIADLKGAMNELVGSGGRGMAALKGVKDSAVEAMEAGAKSIQDMGSRMIAQGVDPTIVRDYIQSLRDNGIRTLQELANASDMTAGGVVASLENRNAEIKKQWENMTNDLKGLSETISKIPTEKDVKINVQTTFDDNTSKLMNTTIPENVSTNGNVKKYAEGGVVNGATFFSNGGEMSVMGEAGAEAILPLSRIGGKLGVKANLGGGSSKSHVINYNVDARGASPETASMIKRALQDVEDRAVRRAVDVVADSSRRGGRWQ